MPERFFHRVETPIQTPELALLQVSSGEIWGREPYGSNMLVVQAYRNELPPEKRGIQFTTPVTPQPGSGTPYEARWYYPLTTGVLLRRKEAVEYAAIPAKVENRQPIQAGQL